MSKTRSKSNNKNSSKSTAKVNPEQSQELPVDGEAEDELSAGEKLLLESKPYWPHILLGVLSLILVSVLWTAWSSSTKESASVPWRDLNNAVTQAGLSNDVSSLKEVATTHEGTAASNWALLMAGDDEINRGVRMLPSDRQGGFKLINTGIESVQRVVDAPAASKTPMVQRRSTFMLAQANEAVGEFELAKGHYQGLLDDAPDCPFASASKRGVERCSNKDLAMVYESFRNFEEAAEVAPGPLVPDAPNLNIDELQLPEGESNTFDAGGGDLSLDKMEDEPVTEKVVSEVEKTPAAETKMAVPGTVEVKTPEAAIPEVKTPEVEVPMTTTPATKTLVEPTTETPVVPVESIPEVSMPEVPAVNPTPITPEIPSEVIPEVPSVEIPAVEVPAVEIPAVEVPDVEVPVVGVPSVEVPAVEIPTAPPAVE